MTGLHVALAEGELALVPTIDEHREPLRDACAADPDIWQIYSISMIGPAFDPSFDAMLGSPRRLAFTVLVGGKVVGCTSYMHDPDNASVEIGFTYLHPAQRGTGLNRRMKKLLIEHGFAYGLNRIELRVDARNQRSQAAVARLGATREGVLRRNKVTWTGHVRDTVVFSLLPGEWK